MKQLGIKLASSALVMGFAASATFAQYGAMVEQAAPRRGSSVMEFSPSPAATGAIESIRSVNPAAAIALSAAMFASPALASANSGAAFFREAEKTGFVSKYNLGSVKSAVEQVGEGQAFELTGAFKSVQTSGAEDVFKLTNPQAQCGLVDLKATSSNENLTAEDWKVINVADKDLGDAYRTLSAMGILSYSRAREAQSSMSSIVAGEDRDVAKGLATLAPELRTAILESVKEALADGKITDEESANIKTCALMKASGPLSKKLGISVAEASDMLRNIGLHCGDTLGLGGAEITSCSI